MTQELWDDVDRYVVEALFDHDPVLDAAQEESANANLPPIAVSAPLGKLLNLVARSICAKRILEVGTLGGYSTIWLGRALPGAGHLDTLEIDPRHAQVAQKNLERAELAQKVTIHVAPAIDTLATFIKEGVDPFDLVFIDADKSNGPNYFRSAMELTKRGSVIIVDNVIRQGHVVEASSTDDAVTGTRKLNEAMAGERRIVVTEIQTVGSKGYDGFSYGLVVD